MTQDQIIAAITASAQAHGIDPNTALAIAKVESSLDPNAINPKSGAVGLFQLMPSSFPGVNIYDPSTNIDSGIGYFANLLSQYNGDQTLALAAYNSGPGNVAKYGGVPPFPETQSYISKVLGWLNIGNSSVDSTSTDATGNSTASVVDTSGGVDPTTIVILGAVALGAWAVSKIL